MAPTTCRSNFRRGTTSIPGTTRRVRSRSSPARSALPDAPRRRRPQLLLRLTLLFRLQLQLQLRLIPLFQLELRLIPLLRLQRGLPRRHPSQPPHPALALRPVPARRRQAPRPRPQQSRPQLRRATRPRLALALAAAPAPVSSCPAAVQAAETGSRGPCCFSEPWGLVCCSSVAASWWPRAAPVRAPQARVRP